METCITSAQEQATLAEKLCPNIVVQYITKDEVEKNRVFLDVQWEKVFTVPGTIQLHFIKPHGSNKVQVSDITDAGQFQVYQI